MAAYNVPLGTSSITETLTASTPDTVTFADRTNFASVTNSGTTVLYCRSDDTAATVGDARVYTIRKTLPAKFAQPE